MYDQAHYQDRNLIAQPLNTFTDPIQSCLKLKFRIWQECDLATSWSVIDCHPPFFRNTLFLREISWTRVDFLADPTMKLKFAGDQHKYPNILVRDCLIDLKEYEQLIIELGHCQISNLLEQRIMTSAVQHGFERSEGIGLERLSWLNEGPAEWRYLINVVEQFKAKMLLRLEQEPFNIKKLRH